MLNRSWYFTWIIFTYNSQLPHFINKETKIERPQRKSSLLCSGHILTLGVIIQFSVMAHGNQFSFNRLNFGCEYSPISSSVFRGVKYHKTSWKGASECCTNKARKYRNICFYKWVNSEEVDIYVVSDNWFQRGCKDKICTLLGAKLWKIAF